MVPRQSRETLIPVVPSRTYSIVELVELPFRCGLAVADAAHGDLGLEVVFAAHRRSEHPAKHRYLAGVRERVCDGPLEDLLGRITERIGLLKPSIEGL